MVDMSGLLGTGLRDTATRDPAVDFIREPSQPAEADENRLGEVAKTTEAVDGLCGRADASRSFSFSQDLAVNLLGQFASPMDWRHTKEIKLLRISKVN
jgi:hypothetical protein